MRHNKKRNSALLYEFLVRYISKSLVEGRGAEAEKAMALSKKYFSVGTTLREELDLFGALLKTKVKSRHSAQRLLQEVVRRSRAIDMRKLDHEKSLLIKEINHALKDKAFFDAKIGNYRVCASVQMVLSEARKQRPEISKIERIKLEDGIIEHVVAENIERGNIIQTNPNHSDAIYQLTVQKYFEKYADRLSENQKGLLKAYTRYLITERKSDFEELVNKHVSDVKRCLREVRDREIREDKDLMERIQESYKRIVVTDFSSLSEECVTSLLQYMQLVEEIQS